MTHSNLNLCRSVESQKLSGNQNSFVNCVALVEKYTNIDMDADTRATTIALPVSSYRQLVTFVSFVLC